MAREYVKCAICGEKVHVDKRIIYNHTVEKSGKTYKKNAHKECYEQWKMDYEQFGVLRETLLRIFDIPMLERSMITSLREYRNGEGKKKGYNYNIINQATLKKEKVIKQNIDKGWRYIFSIIQSGCSEVWREQKKKEKNQKIQQQFKKQYEEQQKNQKEIVIKVKNKIKRRQ